MMTYLRVCDAVTGLRLARGRLLPMDQLRIADLVVSLAGGHHTVNARSDLTSSRHGASVARITRVV